MSPGEYWSRWYLRAHFLTQCVHHFLQTIEFPVFPVHHFHYIILQAFLDSRVTDLIYNSSTQPISWYLKAHFLTQLVQHFLQTTLFHVHLFYNVNLHAFTDGRMTDDLQSDLLRDAGLGYVWVCHSLKNGNGNMSGLTDP